VSQTKAQLLDGSVVSVAFSAGTAGAPSLTFTGDSNTGIYSPGADQVAISTGGSGRLFVDASGRVGIGTSSPSTKLEISGNEATANFIVATNTDAFAWSGFRLRNTGTSGRSYDIGLGGNSSGASTAGNFYVYDNTAGAQRITLNSSGRVGIGTTSPRSLLSFGTADTSGTNGINLYDNGGNYRTGIGATSSYLRLYTPSDGSLQLGRLSTSDGSTFLEAVRIDNSGRLLVGTSTARSNVDASTGLLAPQVQIEGTDAGASSLSIIRNSASSPPRLYLARTKSGSVGGNVAVISDDILGEFLFNGADGTNLIEAASISCGVDGTPGANDMPGRLVFSTTADGASSPTERLRITSAGRVGIGTTSPNFPLSIQTDSSAQSISLFGRAADDISEIAFFENDRTTRLGELQYRQDHVNFRHRVGYISVSAGGVSERLRITSAGLVGVGTSSPSTTLSVAGGISGTAGANISGAGWGVLPYVANSLVIDNNAGEARFFATGANATTRGSFIFYNGETDGGAGAAMVIDSSSRVGIGTSSVSSKLHVQDAHTLAADSQIALIENTTTGEPASLAFLAKADNAGGGNKGAIYFDAGAGGGTADNKLQFTAQHQDTITPAMTLDGSGRLGIGTNNPLSAFVVSDGGANGIEIRPGAGESDIIAYNRSGAAWGNLKLNSANNIFQIQGTEKARIDNSGRLLVGTSSASSTDNDANFPYLQLEGVDGDPSRAMLRCNGGTTYYGEPVLYLSRSGGTSNGSKTSVANGDYLGEILFLGADGADDRRAASIRAVVDGTPGANDMPGRLVFSTTADGASSPTERMRIKNYGQIFTYADSVNAFAIATSGSTSATNACIYLQAGATGIDTGTITFRVQCNGDVDNTNNSYGAISDVKLKENIVDANSQWSDIKSIQVRNYNYKEETGLATHTQIGVIAQEIESISPGLVTDTPDVGNEGNDLGTVTKSVNYSVLYMKAVKALQEAMERIEQLETSNADLLDRVTALESA
jgi:hypothetical protein